MRVEGDVISILREVGRRTLEERFGTLTSISGQGVQGGTRFGFEEGGKRLACAIKVVGADHNRIHFPRDEENNTWKTLRDVDRVLYVRRQADRPSHYESHLYSQATLIAAFDQNWAHTAKLGIKHLPAWLSPEFEEGDRFAGSGFGDKALWKVTGLFAKESPSLDGGPVQPLTPQQAKRGIAALLGISPEAIEIIIRA